MEGVRKTAVQIQGAVGDQEERAVWVCWEGAAGVYHSQVFLPFEEGDSSL